MGMPPFFSSDSNSSGYIQDGNPDPRDFRIYRCIEIRGWTIAIIKYPNCTNYNGIKVCVYDCDEVTLRNQKFLDPHFGSGGLYPIARFEPSNRGLDAAVAMARNTKR